MHEHTYASLYVCIASPVRSEPPAGSWWTVKQSFLGMAASGKSTPGDVVWPLINCWSVGTPRPRSAAARESFDEFTDKGLARIISATEPITWQKSRYYISGHRVAVEQDVTPAACRTLDRSYSADVFVQLKQQDGGDNDSMEVRVCRIPVMLGSQSCVTHDLNAAGRRLIGECMYDDGGYFLIGGKEKAVSLIEVASPSSMLPRVTAASLAPGNEVADGSSIRRGVHTADAAISLFNGACAVFRDERIGTYSLRINLPGMYAKRILIPIPVAFRALGPCSDRDIVRLVWAAASGAIDAATLRQELHATLSRSAGEGPTQQAALASLRGIPGIGGEAAAVRSVRASVPGAHHDAQRCATIALALSACVKLALHGPQSMHPLCDANRDSYVNKRVVTPGVFVRSAFKQRWDEHMASVRADLTGQEYLESDAGEDELHRHAQVEGLARAMFDGVMEETIERTFKVTSTDTSPVFDVPRLTMQGAMAYVCRVVNPLSGPALDQRRPHQVHGSQVGFLCPVETPEGKQVGLAHGLAVMARVSGAHAVSALSADNPVMQVLAKAGVVPEPPQLESVLAGGDQAQEGRIEARKVAVVVDGVVVGFSKAPRRVVQQVRQARRGSSSPSVHPSVGVAWRAGTCVRIATDEGRLLRPVIVVQGLRKLWARGLSVPDSWSRCMDATWLGDAPLVEYIDVEECAASLVTDSLECGDSGCAAEYAEIHASCCLSPVAVLTPYAHRNQAPRNVFSCKQTKQSASVYASTYRTRFDTESHVIHCGQAPILDTAWGHILGTRQLPYGVNAMVAIASFTGYNQEDAVVVNASAVSRGMFVSTHIHTLVKDEGLRDGGVFCDPSVRSVPPRALSYADLEANGLPQVGTKVHAGGAIIGHVTKADGASKDTSLVCDLVTHGRVQHAVLFDRGGTQGRRAKVCLYETRDPVVGDKFSSRHGQKGICGRMLPEADMPVTSSGLVPDLIINPHALPSRMTIGQLLEAVGAKAACYRGDCAVDGTIASGASESELTQGLAPFAEMHAAEVLYNPNTGAQIAVDVVLAPTFYMRLKQMVADKVNASRGARRDQVTGQPVRGRAEAGALRIGEMERDVILAHGVAGFLHESLTVRSDVPAPIPGAAFSGGTFHVPDGDDGTIVCNKAAQGGGSWSFLTDTSVVRDAAPPRAFTLLQAEVLGLGVAIAALPQPALSASYGDHVEHVDDAKAEDTAVVVAGENAPEEDGEQA